MKLGQASSGTVHNSLQIATNTSFMTFFLTWLMNMMCCLTTNRLFSKLNSMKCRRHRLHLLDLSVGERSSRSQEDQFTDGARGLGVVLNYFTAIT